MKKAFMVMSIILMCVLFLGCQAREGAREDQVKQQAAPQAEQPPQAPDAQKQKFDLAIIGEGKLPGIEFGIGLPCVDLIERLGEPMQQDYFEGGYYLDYGKLVFLTDGDESYNGIVTAISLTKGKLWGVEVGMKPGEIKELLGEPDREGTLEAEGGKESDVYQMHYDVKEYAPFAGL